MIGVIYEARPNVTIDVATLCLKTGNATILRGGSETLRSNLALVEAIQAALTRVGLPQAAVQYIADPDRALVTELLRLDKYVDMIIPRGGDSLHRLCREQATIPVITGGMGICHVFVDESADLAERSISWKTPKCSVPACATRSTRCSCTGTWRRHFCQRWPPVWRRAKSSCAPRLRRLPS